MAASIIILLLIFGYSGFLLYRRLKGKKYGGCGGCSGDCSACHGARPPEASKKEKDGPAPPH